MDDKRVVNLSDHVLTQDKFSVLQKGLKFCPTPNYPDPGELKEDLDRLHKRLRQIAHYDNPNENLSQVSQTQTDKVKLLEGPNLTSLEPFFHRKFKKPAKGRGPPGPPNLEAMILTNERDLSNRNEGSLPRRKNLTPGERQALKDLTNNVNIIVKPADKGNATVIQNRIDYLREGYRQLSDEGAYKALDTDPTEDYRKEIWNLVEDMYQNGEIDQRVRDFLMDPVCKASRFYLLPKIHKGITPTPGRPVVSGNGCPTEKISSFVDHFLNPTTQLIKSYVKDTTHFLQLMNSLGKIPQGALLVTLDVVGLYPNIPNDQGLEAARVALGKSRPGPNVKPSNRSLMKLLELVLRRNNFVFNGQHYLQIRGTAIGTKVAVGFANNYMGFFERLFVYVFHKQPLVWLRFIDDIFMIWTHGEESLQEFVTYLNSCVDSIKFTVESSETNVNFLDMKVKVKDQRIHTDLYSKPTDSHSYLLYDSAHPQRCKDSIPYSQFLRVRRICSSDTDYKDNILVLTCHFMGRGYPMKLLWKAAALVQSLDRDELLEMTAKKKEKTENEKVFLITTYNPNYQQLRFIVHDNWEMLGKSPATDFMYERKLMCGYRRPKNLRDSLVRANIPHREGDERAKLVQANSENREQSLDGRDTPVQEVATGIQGRLDKDLS
jgi:hypothetical protein